MTRWIRERRGKHAGPQISKPTTLRLLIHGGSLTTVVT